jgi:hypothetical protein
MKLIGGLAKASIRATTLAFAASGITCQPMLIYPYKRTQLKIVPDEWSTTITYKMFEQIVVSQLMTKLIGGEKKPHTHTQKQRSRSCAQPAD